MMQVPFQGLNGLQAAVCVLERGLRPDIPAGTPPSFALLMQECWAAIPDQRPSFDEIVLRLTGIYELLRSPPVSEMRQDCDIDV